MSSRGNPASLVLGPDAMLAAFEAEGRRCAGEAYQTVWAARALAQHASALLDIAEQILEDANGGQIGNKPGADRARIQRDYRTRRRLIEDAVRAEQSSSA